jgi:hypothetical protein
MPDENMIGVGRRPCALHVVAQSNENTFRNRQLPPTSRLCRWNGESATLPIDVVQSQANHQAEVEHAQRHRIIASALRTGTRKRSKEPPTLRFGQGDGARRMADDGDSRHRGSQLGGTGAAQVHEAQESAKLSEFGFGVNRLHPTNVIVGKTLFTKATNGAISSPLITTPFGNCTSNRLALPFPGGTCASTKRGLGRTSGHHPGPPASPQPGDKRRVINPSPPRKVRLRHPAVLVLGRKLPPSRRGNQPATTRISLRFFTDYVIANCSHRPNLTESADDR